ncbi:MAG: hypothetical protein K6T71_02020 [Candidatus Bipolaricaulota bacterium]|nr:hypothetical protein [Candidatus Bipolaricaulota bacterium]
MTEEKKRDWKEYNEQLVQRGEILLAVESLSGWQEELLQEERATIPLDRASCAAPSYNIVFDGVSSDHTHEIL